MALNSEQLALTQADTFEVRLAYFGTGKPYTDFDWAEFAVGDMVPNGWTINNETDTITPTEEWTDITHFFAGNGDFQETWDGSRITWSVRLHGLHYDPYWLRPGRAICCLYRAVAPTADTGWRIFWVGLVDRGDSDHDYQNERPFTITVRSADAALNIQTCPRLVIGKTNLARDGTAVASSELATPGSEAGNNEFIGPTADVSASNVLDGRIGTLWISQNAPRAEAETPQPEGYLALMVDEVFNEPLPGYSRSNTWWFELVCYDSRGWTPIDPSGLYWYPWMIKVKNSEGQESYIIFIRPAGTANYDQASQYALNYEERGIVCADRQMFEAVTGGARKAKWILEAKSFGSVSAPNSSQYRLFDLHPDEGYIELLEGSNVRSSVAWSRSGASGKVNISNIQPGQSIRRVPSGKANWQIEPYPRPGEKWEDDSYEWLLLTLPEHISTLGEDIQAGATELVISEGTFGWPSSGTGIIGVNDVFTYDSRTPQRLENVSGINSAHQAGTALYPLLDNERMTGWLVDRVNIRRRHVTQSMPQYGSLYVSRYANPRTPGQTGWESDYFHRIQIAPLPPAPRGNESALWSAYLGNLVPPPWTRAVLIKVDQMSDGGRAKINELEVFPSEDTLDDINANNEDLVGTVGEVIKYLVDFYTPFDGCYWDMRPTATWGDVGTLATAVAPIAGVMADLARMHGCVLYWTRFGKIRLYADPWWPGALDDENITHVFNNETVRGQWRLTRSRPEVARVALYAQDGEGQWLSKIVVPPVPEEFARFSNLTREFHDYTVANENAAVDLAWALWWREQNPIWCTLSVKGVGEWCRPMQRFYLEWIDESGETRSYGRWICEAVNIAWGPGHWECRLDLRRCW